LLNDRFELGERLGGGPDYTLYRATAVDAAAASGESIAVAILPASLASDRRAFAELAQAFAELRRLDHPNIARLLELGCDDEVCYVTSELLDGEPLRSVLDHLRPERLDRVEADAVVRAVGSALAYAHRRGVVHGQVRTEHVVITMDHRCVLTGFLAQRLREGAGEPPTVAEDVRALARLALEVYSGLPLREALQRPERVPAAALEAIHSVLRARPSDGTPSVADFLALAGLAVEAPDEAPAPRAGVDGAGERNDLGGGRPRRVPNGPRASRRGPRLVVIALLLAVVASLGGLALNAPTDRDWRESAKELQRVGMDVLSSMAARWTSPEPERPAAPLPQPAETPEVPEADTARAVAGPERGEDALPEADGERLPPAAELTPREEPRLPPPDAAEESPSATAAPSPSVRSAPPVLSLAVDAIAVRENHGAVAIDVVRSGEAATRSSVAWWTTPESADPYDDFASLGTAILEFPPGATVRRVVVPLVDDGVREPDETFVVHLASRPRGATVGRVTATRVTVHDDD
jgi:serine/threonine protein kinase